MEMLLPVGAAVMGAGPQGCSWLVAGLAVLPQHCSVPPSIAESPLQRCLELPWHCLLPVWH